MGHEGWLRRAIITHLINMLRNEKNLTAFLLSEIQEDSNQLSSDGISEFLCDGVIVLHYLSIGSEENRMLEIRKMRFTDHEKGLFPFDIKAKEIEVNTDPTMLIK